MPSRHRTRLSGSAPAVRQVAEALDVFCASERLPDDVAWRFRVALDEIVANIVAYGMTGAARPRIEVLFRRDGDVVEISIADDGPPFDPLARPAPDVTLPLEQRQPGGLGISLVKSLMDDVHYARTSKNILTIRKRITPDGAGGTRTR